MSDVARPVRLHIERLVLDGVGFGPADTRRFEAALTERLATLCRTTPPPLAGGNVGHRVGPAVGAAASPEALGRAVARSVHASLFGGSLRR